MSVLKTVDLAVKYRRTTALDHCTLDIPEGGITALVGANGAGKTTLLNCAVGLTKATTGQITVLDGLAAGSHEARHRVAFVAQDAPLYRNLRVAEIVELTGHLNQTFDRRLATLRLATVGISLKQRVGGLSLGQQAQVSLTMALAKHPELLILDEPLARLDPIARRDFMALVLTAASDDGVSVLYSSHVVSELEHVADFLVILSKGKVLVAEAVDVFVSDHRMFSGPVETLDHVWRNSDLLDVRRAGRQAQVLIRTRPSDPLSLDGWEEDDTTLEELIVAYLGGTAAPASPDLMMLLNASRE